MSLVDDKITIEKLFDVQFNFFEGDDPENPNIPIYSEYKTLIEIVEKVYEEKKLVKFSNMEDSKEDDS